MEKRLREIFNFSAIYDLYRDFHTLAFEYNANKRDSSNQIQELESQVSQQQEMIATLQKEMALMR